MNDPDLERLLSESLTHHADRVVPATRPLPPRAFPGSVETGEHRRRWLAPLASAAAVVAIVGAVAAVQSGGPAHHNAVNGPTPSDSAASASSAGAPHATPVGMTFALANGSTVGVGMPVTALFDTAFTSARELQNATHVTANGAPIAAAWYFTKPDPQMQRAAMVGVLRPKQYWPAHANVKVAVDAGGLSAGTALAFRANATLTFTTGAAEIATIDADAHTLTLTMDGESVGTYPVSLGKPNTPTQRGTKIILERQPSACLHDVAGTYYECGIKFVQRVTYSGEYLLAAPWSSTAGVQNTSSGSTDLRPADAETLWNAMHVGDVVGYPNADGPLTPASDGGYWNVPWATWLTGGLVPTR